MGLIWANGRFADDAQPVILARDRGFLYGDGLFETLRVYDGQVFRLRQHWARLCASAAFLRIPAPWPLGQIADVVGELLHRNDHHEAVARIALTRGSSSPGLGLDGPAEPTLTVVTRPFEPYPERIYSRGADIVISRLRQNADSPLPRHKTANYLLYCLARQEARDAGANDALLLNQCGQVCETSVANIFWVREGGLYTPPVHCGLLPGITRADVLSLAQRQAIPAQEKAIQAGEIFEADEVFMTNSLMEVGPVRRIDGCRIGQEAPGPVTSRLMAAYRDRGSWAADGD